MLPCCALGALFFVQLLAFGRWFKRVILRKTVEENEDDYWKPERTSLKDKARAILSDSHKVRMAGIAICIELVLLIVVYVNGGFQVIHSSYTALVQNAPQAFRDFYECCMGR